MKKTITFLILIIMTFILCLTVTATTSYSESFTYTTLFDNNGWDYSSGGCGGASEKSIPINSSFSTYAFGINDTSDCGFSYSRRIRRALPENFSSGSITLNYDFNIVRDSINLGVPLTVRLQNTTGGLVGINFQHRNGTFTTTGIMTGFEPCNLTNERLIPFLNSSHGKIVINLDLLTYSWFIDDDGEGCLNKVITTDIEHIITAIYIAQQLDTSEDFYSLIDNIILTSTESTIFSVGEPCASNDECITDKCQNGICVYKLFKESCINNIECLSESCVNGGCLKASTWERIDASKDEQFGNDSATNNFIALFIMCGICGFIIWWGRSIMAVILAIGLFIVMSIFFAIVGWLSPFILLGLIVMVLVFFVFMSVIGTGGGE